MADTFAGNFTIDGVTGTVSYDDQPALPASRRIQPWHGFTLYTATVNTSVTDSYGVAAGCGTTAGASPPAHWILTPPTITDRMPAPSATDVAADHGCQRDLQ